MLSEFGRYLILKKIAVGGMAEIFLARRVSMGQLSKFVVLKRLSPEYQGKRSFERLFLTEAKLTGRLSHPNIVQLNDLGQVDGSYFMAMEYIHGVSSAEMMSRAAQKRMPVPLGVALGIILSTARALSYCSQPLSHEGESLDLLHHDVSPHNIQVRFDGVVKLLDFGVATQAQRQEGSSRRGKFAYMSPEAFHRMHLDQRSDLFSLGVVLYELTMGRRLFKGKNQQETKQKAEACVVPRPRSIHDQFPEVLEQLILQALSSDKDQRYQNFEVFIAAIQEVTGQLRIDTSEDRIARYLRELYGEDIEKRSMQLQSLAARAEIIGADPLDEINTLSSKEQVPVNLTGKAIGELPTDIKPQSIGLESLKTPAPLESKDNLFGREVVETEMVEGINAETTPHEQEGASPRSEDLALLGQQERDWDDLAQNSSSRGRSVLWVALLILGSLGGFYMGQQRTNQEENQSTATQFIIESDPVGATVSVGGVMWGVTPFNKEKTLDVERAIIQLSKPGFEAQSQMIEIRGGALIQLKLNLSRKIP